MYEQIQNKLSQQQNANPSEIIEIARELLHTLQDTMQAHPDNQEEPDTTITKKMLAISVANTSNTVAFPLVNNFLAHHTEKTTDTNHLLTELSQDESSAFVILANSVHLCLLHTQEEAGKHTKQDGHEQPDHMAAFSNFIGTEIAKFRQIKNYLNNRTQTNQSTTQPCAPDESAITLLTCLCKTLTTPKPQAKTNAKTTNIQNITNELDRISKGLQKQLISALIHHQKLETQPSDKQSEDKQSEALSQIKEIICNTSDDTNLASAEVTDKISELLRTLQPISPPTTKGNPDMEREEGNMYTIGLATGVTAKKIIEKLKVLLNKHEMKTDPDSLNNIQEFMKALKGAQETTGKTTEKNNSNEMIVIKWIKDELNKSQKGKSAVNDQLNDQLTERLIKQITAWRTKKRKVKNAIISLGLLKGKINCGASYKSESDETTDQFYFSLAKAEHVYILTTAKKDSAPHSADEISDARAAEELLADSARSAADSMKEYMENNNPDAKVPTADLLGLGEKGEEEEEKNDTNTEAFDDTTDPFGSEAGATESLFPGFQTRRTVAYNTGDQSSNNRTTREDWVRFDATITLEQPDLKKAADERDSFNANDIFEKIYQSGESDPVESDPVKIKTKLLNEISRHRKDNLANLKGYFRGKGLENHVTNIISEINNIYGNAPIDNANTPKLQGLQTRCAADIQAIYHKYCEFAEEQPHIKHSDCRPAAAQLRKLKSLFGDFVGTEVNTEEEELKAKKKKAQADFAGCAEEAFESFSSQNKKPS